MTRRLGNWRFTLIGVALFGGILVLSAMLNPDGRSSSDRHPPCTFYSDPSGARALLLVLQDLAPFAGQWRRPLTSITSPPAWVQASTLIVAGPTEPIEPEEMAELDVWLRAGGQLILAADDGWPIARDHDEGSASVSGHEEGSASATAHEEGSASALDHKEGSTSTLDHKEGSTSTLLEHYGIRLAASKTPEPERRLWSGDRHEQGIDLFLRLGHVWTGQFHTLLAYENQIGAIEVPIGQGRLVALGDPEVISNAALKRADNAIWLVNLCTTWGNGGVWIDEFHHGFGKKRSLDQLALNFLGTPWGLGCLQLCLAGLLLLFSHRRRLGRVVRPKPEVHDSPLELVDARAGLFRAATARAHAVEQLCWHVCQTLSTRMGRTIDMERLEAIYRVKPEEPKYAARARRLVALFKDARSGCAMSDDVLLEAAGIAATLPEEIFGDQRGRIR